MSVCREYSRLTLATAGRVFLLHPRDRGIYDSVVGVNYMLVIDLSGVIGFEQSVN